MSINNTKHVEATEILKEDITLYLSFFCAGKRILNLWSSADLNFYKKKSSRLYHFSHYSQNCRHNRRPETTFQYASFCVSFILSALLYDMRRTNLVISSSDLRKIIRARSNQNKLFFIGLNKSSHQELFNQSICFEKFQIF